MSEDPPEVFSAPPKKGWGRPPGSLNKKDSKARGYVAAPIADPESGGEGLESVESLVASEQPSPRRVAEPQAGPQAEPPSPKHPKRPPLKRLKRPAEPPERPASAASEPHSLEPPEPPKRPKQPKQVQCTKQVRLEKPHRKPSKASVAERDIKAPPEEP